LLIRYGEDYQVYLENTGMYFPKRQRALTDAAEQSGGLQ